PTLLPPSLDGWPVAVSHDIDAVLPKADIVYLLRIQAERQSEALLPSLREYTARYGLTRERARLLSDDALVMHPGPMNRGVEIAADVADLPGDHRPRQVDDHPAGGQRGRSADGRAIPHARVDEVTHHGQPPSARA